MLTRFWQWWYPRPVGLLGQYAGQGMGVHETQESAEASFRKPTNYGQLSRESFAFWVRRDGQRGFDR